MKDLEKAVNESISQLIADGTVENIITEKLKKTVDSIVNDCLSSYSDFGKALKEKITKEMKVNLDNVSFSEYNKTILNLVEGIMNKHTTEQVESNLRKQMIKLFGEPPEEIKFSKLVEMYVEESRDGSDREDDERIALLIEQKDKWITVSMNPKTTHGYKKEYINSWHNCDLVINLSNFDEEKKTAKLSWTYDQSGLKPHQFMPTCLHGTSRLLYQMYCAGSTIIFDEGLDPDNYDIYYGEDY